MPTRNYDVFISYRRQGGDAQALFIREKLLQHNVCVFLDVTDLKKGYFDEDLLAASRKRPTLSSSCHRIPSIAARTRATGCARTWMRR